MYEYKLIVGRIISIICNLLLLFFGALMVYTIFKQNTGSGAAAQWLFAIILGIAALAGVFTGLISTSVEIPIVYMNFISPIVSIVMAMVLTSYAAKEPSGSANMILLISGAGLLLIHPVGTILIVSAEGREID